MRNHKIARRYARNPNWLKDETRYNKMRTTAEQHEADAIFWEGAYHREQVSNQRRQPIEVPKDFRDQLVRKAAEAIGHAIGTEILRQNPDMHHIAMKVANEVAAYFLRPAEWGIRSGGELSMVVEDMIRYGDDREPQVKFSIHMDRVTFSYAENEYTLSMRGGPRLIGGADVVETTFEHTPPAYITNKEIGAAIDFLRQ